MLRYLWTHQLRGCLFPEPLSSGRSPAAPSSAQESVRGTDESWWLRHRMREKFIEGSHCFMASCAPLVSLCFCPSIAYSTATSLQHRATVCGEDTLNSHKLRWVMSVVIKPEAVSRGGALCFPAVNRQKQLDLLRITGYCVTAT